MKTIAIKIKDARLRLGLTQTQLANKTNLTYQSVLKIEKGKDFKVSNLLKIYKVLNIPI